MTKRDQIETLAVSFLFLGGFLAASIWRGHGLLALAVLAFVALLAILTALLAKLRIDRDMPGEPTRPHTPVHHR